MSSATPFGAVEMLLSMSTVSVLADALAERMGAPGVNYNTTALDSASPWMTTREAAAYLKLGVSEVQRLAAAGAIPHEQDGGPGGRLYFHADDLDQWRRSGGRRAA